MNNLLQESLSIHPLILENHFPKAYLALDRLVKIFPTLDASRIWKRQDTSMYPKTEEPICLNVHVPHLFAEREQRMLTRSLFPSVYGIVRKKIEMLGMKSFLKPYLRLSIEDPEYLGHRLTVLISFYESWPLVEEDIKLKSLWMDRLTEFLMLSFNAKPTEYSLKKVDLDETLEFADLLTLGLERPGYFGCHLIALATTLRFEKELLKAEKQMILSKIKNMMLLDYQDGEDYVVINQPQTNEPLPDLEKMTTNYLIQGPEDPHLLIFAEAMVFLWSYSTEDQKRWIVSNFTRFMRH